MEEMKVDRKKRLFGKERIILIVIILTSFIVGQKLGYNNARMVLKDKKLTVQQIEKEISDLKEQKISKEEEFKKIEDRYQEAKSLIGQKEELEKNIKNLEKSIQEKKEEDSSLDTKLADKQKELEFLTNGIIQKKKEPRVLSAGEFIVGKDIPAGRYKIEPNNGSGNYFVNEGRKANIILGNQSNTMYLKEYILELDEGDSISATLSTKYTLIE
ncbi:hypothetical protein [Garciella nitratireducens]|uniref:hypothetical protein n=1 Tax=Garciella nitratireducens TaxID=218205 RepID=UPI000E01BBE8|nr:hypothetical protein [Garciella nitratireducens]RBP36558.1 hypothetical protein DFR81_12915 [Garciella nitratireducens]